MACGLTGAYPLGAVFGVILGTNYLCDQSGDGEICLYYMGGKSIFEVDSLKSNNN
jgi:hypothetical protein